MLVGIPRQTCEHATMPRAPAPRASRTLLANVSSQIAARLPPGWRSSVIKRRTGATAISFTSPDGRTGALSTLVRTRLDPRAADTLGQVDLPSIVVADWLSPRTRTILAGAGLSYADTTGNVLVMISDPGLSITAEGAGRDPSPREVGTLNLRGPRAWALERTLAEVLPPYGVGDLSDALGIDAGYVSRLLAGLTDELVIERLPRQPVDAVDWEAAIRQIARTYSLLESNETASWIAAAGPEQLLRDLSRSKLERWAVTGSFASSRLVSITAPEVAVVYSDDPDELAETLRLRPTRTGGNVVTAVPYDPIVFERTWVQDDLVLASVAQIAVDCLTGFARMPSEGDALLAWMRRRAPRWQSPALSGKADLP